jgi:hypothetical protein
MRPTRKSTNTNGSAREPAQEEVPPSMRKHLIWIVVGVVSLSVAAVAYAANTTTGNQTIGISPSKLSKKQFKNVKLHTDTTFLYNGDPGSPTAPTLTPAAAKDVKLKFDDDIKFTTKGLPTCKASKLEQTTTAQALAKCGKSKVGTGSATVCVIANPGTPCGGPFTGAITAFNGTPKNGNPTIVLHVRVDALSVTTILVGTLKGGGTGDFGSTLDVPVPSTLPTATTDFNVIVTKKYTFKGKKYSYVAARCHDSNHQLNLQTTITYNQSQAPGEDPDHPTDFQTCST